MTASFKLDHAWTFSQYMENCRALITARRPDLQSTLPPEMFKRILNANMPFEYKPVHDQREKIKYGALLIHGLFDSPFTLQEIGHVLQAEGVWCRGVLLPGHGTSADDLLSVTYDDWIKTVRYAVLQLRKEVDHLIVVGYSTGATLALQQVLAGQSIDALVLIAPALRISMPIYWAMSLQKMLYQMNQKYAWLYHDNEISYAKYKSIPFFPIEQVHQLAQLVNKQLKKNSLPIPMLLVATAQDQTISTKETLRFFSASPHPKNICLLYGEDNRIEKDSRIILRKSNYPALHIQSLSHISLPFSALNSHYGINGDYPYAPHDDVNDVIYGSYNQVEEKLYDGLYKLGLMKNKRLELTYNPDFDFMAKCMIEFIFNK